MDCADKSTKNDSRIFHVVWTPGMGTFLHEDDKLFLFTSQELADECMQSFLPKTYNYNIGAYTWEKIIDVFAPLGITNVVIDFRVAGCNLERKPLV